MEERCVERVDDGEVEDAIMAAVRLYQRGPGGKLRRAGRGDRLESKEGWEGEVGRELEPIRGRFGHLGGWECRGLAEVAGKRRCSCHRARYQRIRSSVAR